MRLGLLISVAMLIGCPTVTISGDPKIFGSSFDVKTQPGFYDGYQVIGEDCGWDGSPVVRNPFGSKNSTWSNRHALIERLEHLAFRDIDLAAICEHRGRAVELNDWRDIDEAIAIVGTYLVEADLTEPFFITVKDNRDWSGSGRGLCCGYVGSAVRRSPPPEQEATP